MVCSGVSTTATAHHKQEGKQYAIKTFHKIKVTYPQMRDQIAVLAKSTNENIVSFKEVFQDSKSYYLVTELYVVTVIDDN